MCQSFSDTSFVRAFQIIDYFELLNYEVVAKFISNDNRLL